MEAAVLSAWPSLELTAERRQRLSDLIKDIANHRDAEAETCASSARAQLEATKQRLSRLIDAFIDGAIDKSLFETRKQSLLEEQLSLEQRLNHHSAGSADANAHLLAIIELVCTAQQSYRLASDPQRREMIMLLLSNRSVAGKQVFVEPYIPLAGPLKAVVVQCCAQHRDANRTCGRAVMDLLEWTKNVEPERVAKLQLLADSLALLREPTSKAA